MQPFVIVGQGIAGTLLAWCFEQYHIPYLLYDKGNADSATAVASGIINPVTGKRFVKSWLIDEALPVVKATYCDIEKAVGEKFFHEVPIYKLLKSIQQQNDVSLRINDSDYISYLADASLSQLPAQYIKNPYKCVTVSGGGWVNTVAFLQTMRALFLQKNVLIEEDFSGKKNNHQTIVWCNGYAAQSLFAAEKNPFLCAKGEHLLCEIPDLNSADAIINSEVAISPTAQKDVYYVGATFEWNFSHIHPTAEKREEIEAKLRSFLNIPYKVVAHRAAVRPTTKDRRPLVGKLSENNYIFNGFGTKGMSLTAYFAHILTKNITHQSAIPDEVNPLRF